jgi:predicted short-subunit dehydrogenase-like oxidoreductase (DUF2520 family)
MTIQSAPGLKIGFIGAGRLSTALAWGFARKGCAVVAATSRTRASAERLAAAIPGCAALATAQQVADAAELVFIGVNDTAIAEVAAGARWRPGTAVVHCSGATEVSVLAPAAAQGAQIGGFHPMQTFADAEAALASLPGCTVSLEAAQPLLARLQNLAALLGCRSITLPEGVRVRYHASGAYASQYVVALLAEAAKLWASFGIGEEDAIRALLPLLRGTAASVERAGLVQGMPGPVSRGDLGTVRRHLDSLDAFDPQAAALYRQLALRTVWLAQTKGVLNEEQLAQLREWLGANSD